MTNLKKKIARILGSVFALAALFALAGFWLYTGSVSSAKIDFFRLSRLPLGSVGTQYITLHGVEKNLEARVNTQTLKSSFDAYAEQVKIKQISKELGALDRKLAGDVSEYERLAVWWAENYKLNPKFNEMKKYETAVSSGADFSDLAKLHSEDDATRLFGGDAGYVNLDETLPEFKEAVSPMKAGDYKIFGTRKGLELVKVEETLKNESGQSIYKIRHIFLTNQGFEQWLTAQQKERPVKYYLD